MNAKTLRTLLIVAVVLSVLAVITSREKQTDATSGEDNKTIWSHVAMNTASELAIQSSEGSVTLLKADSGWTIKEKHGYPIKFDQLRKFLGDMYALKIGETIHTTDAQKKEMKLLSHDAGAGAGTRVTLKSADGKEMISFIAGKTFSPAGDKSNPMAMAGTSGRYIAIGDKVHLVYNDLGAIDGDPDTWYDSELLSGSASDIVQVTVTGPERKTIDLARSTNGTDFVLANLPEGHEPVASKINSLTGALGYLRFDDIAAPTLSDADTGLDHPVVYAASRQNSQTVKVSIGKEAEEGKRYARISFTYEPVEEADKTNDVVASTAEAQKKHGEWIYLLSDFKSDTFLTSFEDLSQEKAKIKEEGSTTKVNTPSIIQGTE